MKGKDGAWDPLDDYVVDFALERMRAGERVAIVTLVRIEGSSPRPLGAQMAVSETGQWVGYLSGGCIERAVAAEAVQAIREDESRLVRYGRGSRYVDIRLPCGSAIDLVFDVRLSLAEAEAIDARLRQRLPAVMDIPLAGFHGGSEWLQTSCRCRTYLPRRRLAVLGVGPVAMQLARLARVAGFHVSLYSPDEPTLQAVGTLDVEAIRILSPASLPEIDTDFRTAVVFAFHDHDWEEKLLAAAIKSDAFYIGAMGSRATHQVRLRRLESQGFSAERLVRLHGPAGLLPHARNAADIALSILAQVIEVESNSESLVPAGGAKGRRGTGEHRRADHASAAEAYL